MIYDALDAAKKIYLEKIIGNLDPSSSVWRNAKFLADQIAIRRDYMAHYLAHH